MVNDPFGLRPRASLDPATVDAEVRRFLAEDVGTGDVTTARVVPAPARARASVVARERCVIAGLPAATAVFRVMDEASACAPA